MKKIVVNESLVMPGGWHKFEKDRLGNPMPEPIRGNTYKNLIQNVIKFRVDNIIPIEGVQEEIDNYIFSIHPVGCKRMYTDEEDVKKEIEEKHRSGMTDEMVGNMVASLEGHSMENLEFKGSVGGRADICRGCKFNIPWSKADKERKEMIERTSATIRFGQDVDNPEELKMCQILKHENRSAIWLRLDKVKNHPDLPKYCWAKREKLK